MANLFKPTYTKPNPEAGERTIRRTRKWYGQYRDANGIVQRVPLCTDKTAAQAMLTDLVRKAERQQAGLIDPAADQLARVIQDHVDEYRTHLVVKGRSEKHISETIRLLKNITAECRCRILADLQAGGDSLEQHLANRHESGSSHRTINADLIAVRSFCRWLIEKKRMHDDPTLGLIRLNEEEDRRRERRALTDGEAQQLIQTTYRSKQVFRRLTGVDRAIMYLLAQRTGLRRKELRSLTPLSFNLEGTPPTVQLKAARSKRRKSDVLPLPSDVAQTMAEYLGGHEPDKPVWPGSWWRRSAEMLRLDLAAAGIEPVDAEGYVVDFHGQRMTFITGLARAGVPPAMAQKLARHSDINLTLRTYTHLQVEDLVGAVEKLPVLSPTVNAGSKVVSNAEKATAETAADDPELGGIIKAWGQLPKHVKQAILALVAAGIGNSSRPPNK